MPRGIAIKGNCGAGTYDLLKNPDKDEEYSSLQGQYKYDYSSLGVVLKQIVGTCLSLQSNGRVTQKTDGHAPPTLTA